VAAHTAGLAEEAAESHPLARHKDEEDPEAGQRRPPQALELRLAQTTGHRRSEWAPTRSIATALAQPGAPCKRNKAVIATPRGAQTTTPG
jgi:hypothetical protein